MTFRSRKSFFRQNRGLLLTANLLSGERFEGWNRSDKLPSEAAKKTLTKDTSIKYRRQFQPGSGSETFEFVLGQPSLLENFSERSARDVAGVHCHVCIAT